MTGDTSSRQLHFIFAWKDPVMRTTTAKWRICHRSIRFLTDVAARPVPSLNYHPNIRNSARSDIWLMIMCIDAQSRIRREHVSHLSAGFSKHCRILGARKHFWSLGRFLWMSMFSWANSSAVPHILLIGFIFYEKSLQCYRMNVLCSQEQRRLENELNASSFLCRWAFARNSSFVASFRVPTGQNLAIF